MKPKDVSYSSFLSGGNDSAFVCLGLRNNYEKQIDAYTYKLGEQDTDYIRSKYITQKLNLNQKIINFNTDSFLKSIEEQVLIYGEPYFHITSVFSDQILKEVKKKHKVIFTGAGGDELYYGYNNLLFIKISLFLHFVLSYIELTPK
jgi:asparagine synthase (glutamine-hydrolysing)